jgi:hypothetical protein
MAGTSICAWWRASASAGGMVPMASRRRRLLDQSTYSSVANSTASRFRQGPRRWMASVSWRPLMVSARALYRLVRWISQAGPSYPVFGVSQGSEEVADAAGSIPASAKRSVQVEMPTTMQEHRLAGMRNHLAALGEILAGRTPPTPRFSHQSRVDPQWINVPSVRRTRPRCSGRRGPRRSRYPAGPHPRPAPGHGRVPEHRGSVAQAT